MSGTEQATVNHKDDETKLTDPKLDKSESDDDENQGANHADDEGSDSSATDWKAKSRMWEKRAKANLDKAKAYDALEQSSKTADERLAELEKKFAETASENLKLKIATDKGVPADLLYGDTEEELIAHADALLEFTKEKHKTTAPVVGSDGKVPSAEPKKSLEDAFFDFFSSQIG